MPLAAAELVWVTVEPLRVKTHLLHEFERPLATGTGIGAEVVAQQGFHDGLADGEAGIEG